LGRCMTKRDKTAEELKQYRETVAAKYNEYMLALGRFVSQFSNIESQIQRTLWKFSGVLEPTAQAVFSGVRTDGCIQYLNRIAGAQRWSDEKKNELEYVLSQLGMINKLRNDILHYGSLMAWPFEDAWLITNKPFVHMPERIQEIRVGPKLLKDATADLRKIKMYLFLMMHDVSIFDPEMSAYVPEPKHAWLYKPPPRGRAPRKSR